MRINARLDKKSEEDLLFIKEQSHATTTQIIKELLAERAEHIKQKNIQGSKLKAFLSSDFIACANGPEDGSVNYKNYVTEVIDNKI